MLLNCTTTPRRRTPPVALTVPTLPGALSARRELKLPVLDVLEKPSAIQHNVILPIITGVNVIA